MITEIMKLLMVCSGIFLICLGISCMFWATIFLMTSKRRKK